MLKKRDFSGTTIIEFISVFKSLWVLGGGWLVGRACSLEGAGRGFEPRRGQDFLEICFLIFELFANDKFCNFLICEIGRNVR